MVWLLRVHGAPLRLTHGVELDQRRVEHGAPIVGQDGERLNLLADSKPGLLALELVKTWAEGVGKKGPAAGVLVLVGEPVPADAEAETGGLALLAACLVRLLRSAVHQHLETEGVYTFAAFVGGRFNLATCFDWHNQTLVQFHPLVLEGSARTLLDELLLTVRDWVVGFGFGVFFLKKVVNTAWGLVDTMPLLHLGLLWLFRLLIRAIFHLLADVFEHAVDHLLVRRGLVRAEVVIAFLKSQAQVIGYLIIVIEDKASIILGIQFVFLPYYLEGLHVGVIPLESVDFPSEWLGWYRLRRVVTPFLMALRVWMGRTLARSIDSDTQLLDGRFDIRSIFSFH
jgi:hypothetical protein